MSTLTAVQVAAGAAVAGTAVSVVGSIESAKAQKEAGQVQTASQRVEDAANIRKQAREARIQRARILQASEASGGGSRESGAISSLSTQLGEQKGRVAGQQATAQTLGGINQRIADSQTTQAFGQVIKSAGSFAFDRLGGFDNLFKEG